MAFDTLAWDEDYSPWPAENGNGRFFAGGAQKTLLWAEKYALPLIRRDTPAPVYLMGYSLAGLFALSCLYEAGGFGGAVCCSASLWYPGWMEFARTHRPYPGCEIYLSLGGKEKNTSDPLMSTIEDAVKEQDRLLREDPGVKRSVLRMVPGGHFADSVKRLAAGVDWMLSGQAGTEGRR